MIERVPAQARTLALGRVRYVEGLRRWWTSGANSETLTMVVSFAGHEIDAFEQWYLDDIPVTLDGSGWVKRASYGTASGYTTTAAGFAKGVSSLPLITGTGTMLVGDVFRINGDPTYYTVTTGISAPGTVSFTPALLQAVPASATAVALFQHPFNQSTLEVRQAARSGDGDVTLDAGFIASSVQAQWTTGSGEGLIQGAASVSISGSTAMIGSAGSADVFVTYTVEVFNSRVRIRPYLGTSSQNVGADLAAEYPDKITSADKFAGIALAVVDYVWSQEAFPSGRPTPTAVFRGAKCYDWRKDSTVAGGSGSHRQATPSTWEWSDNPAVCAGRYFAWQGGWGCDLAWARVADMQAAAAACETSTAFTVGSATVTLPRYRCGVTIPSDADHQAAMDIIVETLAGRQAWVGDTWRLRAGTLNATAFTIDESWLGMAASEDMAQDDQDGDPWIRATQALPAQQRTNRVIGSCVDPDQRYQMVPYPSVEDSTLIAAKGTRQDQADLPGVNHIAHAQLLGKIKIREAQAGLRMALMCGWKAWKAEPLDVIELTLPTYGITSKTMEVTETHVDPTGGFPIALAEITADIFDPTATLQGRDPAPDSGLRPPWNVERATGLTVTSGAAAVLDTSILTRTVLTLTPAVDAAIRNGGRVEFQYTEAAAALPDSVDWPAQFEAGNSESTVIVGLLTGRFYLFRARFVQTSPPVNGPWSDSVRHQIAARRSTKIFRQDAEPTGDVIEGDEWFDTNDGNAYYVRVSGAWVATKTGTGGLETDAATIVVSDTGTLGYSFNSSTGGFPYRVQRLLPISWTNSTGATVTVEMTGEIRGTKSAGPGSVWLSAANATSPLTSGIFSSLSATDQHTDATSGERAYTFTDQLAVSPGATIYFALTVFIFSAFGTTTDYAGTGRLRIVAIKR